MTIVTIYALFGSDIKVLSVTKVLNIKILYNLQLIVNFILIKGKR